MRDMSFLKRPGLVKYDMQKHTSELSSDDHYILFANENHAANVCIIATIAHEL